MKNITKVVLLFMTLGLTGQNNFIMPDSLNQIFINTKGGFASTSIPQVFMNKFIVPDYINNELKDIASEKTKEKNYLGGSFSFDFNTLFSSKNDSSETSNFYGIGLGTKLETNLRFTDDLFNLIFYGNEQFANQTLNLNKTNFNSLSYSYLEFSLGKSYLNENSKSNIWIDLGLIIGHSFSTINFNTASIFTAQNGEYLDVSLLESSITLSDTSTSSLAKGFGAKIDVFYSRQSKNSKFLFSTENIGTIFWRNNESALLDTTFRFDGLEIGNIFQLSDSIWDEVPKVDSLISVTKKSNFKSTPIDFSAYFRKDLKLFYFDVLARYRLFANYTPLLRAGINFNAPFINPGITTLYGGYGKFNFGVNTDVNLHKTLKIQIGTNNLLGVLMPNHNAGLDIYFGLKLKFD